MWQDYQNAFINTAGSRLEHIREMLYGQNDEHYVLYLLGKYN
jgi:hypothetical protein